MPIVGDQADYWNKKTEDFISWIMVVLKLGYEPEMLEEIFVGVFQNLCPDPEQYAKLYSDIPILVQIAVNRLKAAEKESFKQ